MRDLESRRQDLCRELGEEVTLDALTGDFKIFQRKRGHRYSTDDLLTAWYAATLCPSAPSQLDLGTGIGSVGLSCLWKHRTRRLVGIEAQAVSFRLLRENVWANEAEDEVELIHGDLRELAAIEPKSFALVTGSPPYFGPGAGIVPADSQKAHARFELRGDIRDYCRAAERALAPGGTLIFCFPTPQLARALAACAEHDLAVLRRREVVPKADLPALFSLFACQRRAEAVAQPQLEPPLVVRIATGERTRQMDDIRAFFGMA